MLLKPTLSKEFVKGMTEQEKVLAEFLRAYYDTSFTKRYTNLGKVCMFKEIDIPLIPEDTTCSSPSENSQIANFKVKEDFHFKVKQDC